MGFVEELYSFQFQLHNLEWKLSPYDEGFNEVSCFSYFPLNRSFKTKRY